MKHFSRIYQTLCDGIVLLNETFTFHLIPIMINTFVMQLFTAYGVLWEFMNPSNYASYILFQDVAWLSVNYAFQVVMAFVGSSLSKSAKETSLIIAKNLNELDINDELSTQLHNFVSRSQCLNFEVQNKLFFIDWKLLVTVSFKYSEA